MRPCQTGNNRSAKHLHRPCIQKIKLKLRHHCINFRLFTTWKSLVHGIPFESGLTRKVRQLVMFHNDLIGSDWISRSGRTRRHQFIHIAHGLHSNRNVQLLGHIVTHCSGCQWRNLTVVWTNCVPVSARTSLQYLCFARQPRERMGFCTSHAWKSTRIVRASGRMKSNPTSTVVFESDSVRCPDFQRSVHDTCSPRYPFGNA